MDLHSVAAIAFKGDYLAANDGEDMSGVEADVDCHAVSGDGEKVEEEGFHL